MELKEKMDRMVEELNAANYRYYVLDDPTMDDRDYDLKLRELEELEKDHPELAPCRFAHKAGGRRGPV